jgi:hypothetical protein
MWSFTDPLWEAVFKWATVAAAVFGGIGIAAAFVSAWVGYKITDATQKEADKNIAEARAETERAKLEQERIKAALAWRTLTPEMTAKLTENLSKSPSNVNIRYTDGDPEALFLAIQFANILQKAKWQTGLGALKIQNTLLFGIWIPGNGAPTQTLRDSFAAALVPFSAETLPPTGISIESAASTVPAPNRHFRTLEHPRCFPNRRAGGQAQQNQRSSVD